MTRTSLKIGLALLAFLVTFGLILAFAPGELRQWAIYILVGLLCFYDMQTFRNWRLRRKLERISRESIERMKERDQSPEIKDSPQE